ncbi:hypothetical protein EVAR_29231_1 [Eumeta japonica]|uniref:Uncharacterized protein n=1 Tax=Eumeta variegata TaxID=151549 RepID=A0A4C1VJ13_EUMVA|nr:hypothetical protein EVAR_29231_1 [Eumeta japonica]
MLTHAAPRSPACGVAPSVACASCSARVVAFCGLPHRAPRPPRPPSISFYHTTRPACRAVVASSHHLRCCGSVRHRPNTLAATAMDKAKLQAFLTERGHLDLLREFEAYCSSPASPDPQVVVFDPEMDLEYTLPRSLKNGQRTLARQRARLLTLNPTPGQVTLPITRDSPRSGAVEPLKVNPKRQASRRPLMGLCVTG